MSKAALFSSQSFRYLRQTAAAPDPRAGSHEVPLTPQFLPLPSWKSLSIPRKCSYFLEKIPDVVIKEEIITRVFKEGFLQNVVNDNGAPVSIELEPIDSENRFDQIISEAQQLSVSVIVVWMATWCRKCIYLKPKLEKLAADYYQRLRFCEVDVNNVPHKLVARAEVTKMPTIQLWKDGKKQGEVIGGHKAYLVVDEVRQMIENECTV